MQNMKQFKFKEDKTNRPVFDNWVRLNGCMWFWDINFNGLFFIRNGEDIAENVPLKCNKGKSLKRGRNHSFFSRIGAYGDNLIFSPNRYDSILIYNVSAKTEEYIPLPDIDWWEGRKERGKFGNIVLEENYAFLLGDWCTYLIRMDLRTKEVRAVNLFYSEKMRLECNRFNFYPQEVKINQNPNVTQELQFFRKGVLWGEKLIVSVTGSNQILMIDRRSLTMETINISHNIYGFIDICCRGNNLWLLPMEPEGYTFPVIHYDMKDGTTKQFSNYPKELQFSAGISFRFIIEKDDKCYLLPGCADKVVELDVNLPEMKTLNELSARLSDMDNSLPKVYFAEIFEDSLCIYSGTRRSFLNVNLRTGEIKERIVCVTDEYRKQRRKNEIDDLLKQKGGYINEKKYSLQDFIDYCLSCL